MIYHHKAFLYCIGTQAENCLFQNGYMVLKILAKKPFICLSLSLPDVGFEVLCVVVGLKPEAFEVPS